MKYFSHLLASLLLISSTAWSQFSMYSVEEDWKAYLSSNLDRDVDLDEALTMHYRMADYESVYNALRGLDPVDVKPELQLLQGHACKSMGSYDEAKTWYAAYAKVDAYASEHFIQSCDHAMRIDGQPSQFTVQNLTINTIHSDYGPSFMEPYLTFSSHRSDISRHVKRKEQELNQGKSQLYKARLSEGSVEHPEFLRGELQDVFGEGPVSFSEDSRIAAFVRGPNWRDQESKVDPNDKSLSIYLAVTDGKGDWTYSEPFPYNSTSYSNAWPFLMNKGKTMYFASNRSDGFGGYDLYVTHRKDGEWTIPQNLGSAINTKGNEVTPYLSNGSMYFASDWHPGLGGLDVFKADIENGRYSRISHLGTEINSGYDDFGMILSKDESSGYFTSNRPGGQGAEDIYEFRKTGHGLNVLVLDATNNHAVKGAKLKVLGQDQVYVTDHSGRALVVVHHAKRLSIEVSHDGYQTSGRDISINGHVDQSSIKLMPSVNAVKHRSKSVINSTSVIAQASHHMSVDDLQESKQMTQSASTTTNRTREVSVYSIQLASIFQTQTHQVDMRPYKQLYDLGTLYKKDHMGVVKIRLGSFDTREEAVKALARVKQRGYKDAFLVVESKTILIDQPTTTAASPPIKNASSVSSQSMSTSVNRGLTQGYKVRLAALSQPHLFNSSQFGSDLTVESDQKGLYTIMYASGYHTYEDAHRAMIELKRKGFNEAYVVIYKNGIINAIK